MTERKRTKREERSYSEMLEEIEELEKWNRDSKLKRAVIPPDWHKVARHVPVRSRKTRITAAFDADLVKWFRSLGHGYQARMNAVLRAYMLAVISREIDGDR